MKLGIASCQSPCCQRDCARAYSASSASCRNSAGTRIVVTTARQSSCAEGWMVEMMAFQAVVIVCGTVAFVSSLRFLRRYLELRHERPPPPAAADLPDRLHPIQTS